MIKKILLGLLALVVIVGLAGVIFVKVQVSAFDESMAKVYDFPLTEVTLTEDPVQLQRGKHLVEAIGACIGCHGENLGGGKEEEFGPLGKIVYPNITPSADGRLSKYSDAELMRLFRHGVKRDGTSVWLMPVQEMSWWPDADWVAVISYLRHVQPVAGQKGALGLTAMAKVLDRIDSIPIDTARRVDHQAKPASTSPAASADYGKLLAIGCKGCHGEKMSGGKIPGTPPEVPIPRNLTPHETGLKGWAFEDFVTLMRTGVRKNGQKLDPFMPIVAFKNFDETELKALWAYLGSLPPTEFGNR